MNPCANLAIANGAVFKRADFMTDFATMVWARNLVLSRSSFARAALYLSPFPKNFYVFHGYPNLINARWNDFRTRFLEHGDHWECRASKEYLDLIVPNGTGAWNSDDAQRTMLLTDRCTWHRVRLADRSYVPVPPASYDVGCGYTVTL
jgi:hypothetical protein